MSNILTQGIIVISQLYLEQHLRPTWQWLVAVMDSTEAQLRFGSALSNNSDPSCPQHPLHTNYSRTQRERSAPPREEARSLQVLEHNRRRLRFGTLGKLEALSGILK